MTKTMATSNEQYLILVVDDDTTIQTFLVECLAHSGHLCEKASDGEQALEMARQKRFDAVITDIVMPRMDGIALTKALLRLYPDLPVMVMTGFTGEYSVKTALDAGASEFMEKPFSVAQFLLRFDNMMKHHQRVVGLKSEKNEIAKASNEFIRGLQEEARQEIEQLKKQTENS